MLGQYGRDSTGYLGRPLGIARENDHYNIVQYLIAQLCANNIMRMESYFGIIGLVNTNIQ